MSAILAVECGTNTNVWSDIIIQNLNVISRLLISRYIAAKTKRNLPNLKPSKC